MRCIITAGPTYEPLDEVRRLTNFSSGRLGCELAAHLNARGHEVVLLLGVQSTWAGERRAHRLEPFTTTADLQERLGALASDAVDAVYHAAAVSDFCFGNLWRRSDAGELISVRAGKIPTREGTLLAELRPTPKIIARLRDWFPRARLVGWKYEVDGTRETVLHLALSQIRESRTDVCVANGPAYGPGFGLVRAHGPGEHVADRAALLRALETP